MPYITTVGSLSKCKEISLARTVPVLSTVKVRIYPVPATILSARACGFGSCAFYSLASRVTGVVSRCTGLDLEFSTVYANCLNSGKRVSVVYSFVRGTKGSTLVIISPIVNSGRLYSALRICSREVARVISGVERLTGGTSVVAPGLARTCLLLNRRCIGPPLDSGRLYSLLGQLSTLKTRGVTVADIVAKGDRVSINVCSGARREFCGVSYKCVPHPFRNAKSVFTTILAKTRAGNCDFVRDTGVTINFVHRTVTRATGRNRREVRGKMVFRPILTPCFTGRGCRGFCVRVRKS